MATPAQLAEHSDQLLASVKHLADLDSSGELWIQNPDPDADKEIKQVKANILANVEAIKTLVRGPTDFLQHLASQVCPRLTLLAKSGAHALKPPY
jgi:hypothetical protein